MIAGDSAVTRLTWVAILLVPLIISDDGHATPKSENNPWKDVTAPSDGPAESIGGYSAGCIAGARALEEHGPGYELTRPSRQRFFGHPHLIDFIEQLGASLSNASERPVLVADLGQARGGPAPGGHSSHQTGLDVDLWYWAPAFTAKRTLTADERERLKARPVVSTSTHRPTRWWSTRIGTVLRTAARNPRVARIFVNPAIKLKLCEENRDDRTWLAKLRPWWGHASHFHVRLHCPARSPDCEPQAPIEEGDGCAELDWWLDARKQAERKQGRAKYRGKVRALPELPERCSEIVGP